MRFIIIIILACQMLFCYSRELDSTLSCILSRSDGHLLTDRSQEIDELLDEINNDSIDSKIKFHLYTQQYPNGKEIIFKDEQSLKDSGYEANLPTRIITHGFNGRGHDDACMGPMKGFLSNGRFNVIIMDWYKYQSLNYFDVVRKVKPTGLHLLEMMNFLIEHGMNASTTTLIGHSLGAHVMGIAGYNSKSQINHVVGIDPAEPKFTNKGPGERISRDDATYVEIIHTNGGHCGIKEAVGHYDFYFNGGSKQPGCGNSLCSHARSYKYYTEAITSSIGFYGKRCDDVKSIEKDKCTGEIVLMGGLMQSIASPGIYFVETNSESPYAKGYPEMITDRK